MTERPEMGVQQFRETLRTQIDAAWADGVITLVHRHGQPVAALVPYKWLQQADAALAGHDVDPT
jgi:antitoxin (DNA-binding transcriptional repressor) of toxin-antitoxin stability system